MKRTISLKGISEHRRVFMGIAIVFIMLCHNTLLVPNGLAKVHNVSSVMLQCGVDIFMLLSGLGLFYSFRKNSKISTFWKKRYKKILIPYIIVVVIYGIVCVGVLRNETLLQYVWKYSLISFFWEGKLTIWFVAAILMLYTVFPCLYALLQKSSRIFALLTAVVAAVCVVLSYLPCPGTIERINVIFVSRVPAFLVGMIIAKSILDAQNVKVPTALVWLVLGISAALIIWYLILADRTPWVIVRLLFLPFTLSGMLLLGKAMKNNRKNGFLYRGFSFLGGITLEIYLLHERVLAITDLFVYKFSVSHVVMSFILNVLAVLVSVAGAWGLQKVIKVASGKVKCNLCKAKH